MIGGLWVVLAVSLVFLLVLGLSSAGFVSIEREVGPLKVNERSEIEVRLESKESEFDLVEILPKEFEVYNEEGNYESYDKEVREYDGKEMVFHHYKFGSSTGSLTYKIEPNSKGEYKAYSITIDPSGFEKEDLDLKVKDEEQADTSSDEGKESLKENETEKEVNETQIKENQSKEDESPITGYAVKNGEDKKETNKSKFSRVNLKIRNQLNFFFR